MTILSLSRAERENRKLKEENVSYFKKGNKRVKQDWRFKCVINYLKNTL